jgi:mRNA interferase RelE/StbE
MGSYKVALKRSVEKDIRRIDKGQVPDIVSAIEALSENPLPSNSRKLVGSEHTYRLRVGDYRVIYFLFHETLEIEIQRVGHRKDVYR